jgi:RNA polymerase sigma factor (sigma-70 family)
MDPPTASSRPLADSADSPELPWQTPEEGKATLQQVFETEESLLLRYAFGLVGQRETAEDLVQEAFVRLHAHWAEVTTPRAWLLRTIRNLALNHLRDHQREIPLETQQEWAGDSADPEQALGKLEALGTLQLLLAELPSADRALIRLKYHQHLKYEQISRHTGLSVGNVGYKLHHLLKHLADSLRHLGIESAEG